MLSRGVTLSIILASLCILSSCVHKLNTPPVADGNYPPEINKIFETRCAITGCHDNAADAEGASGLLMDTWDHLFKGSYNGAVVVPYSPQYSPLLYFINTDPSQGPIIYPTMPSSTPNKPQLPLTEDEYKTISSWIAQGAPDKNGNIAFASNPDTRQKIYIAQQGCDVVAVIDAATMQIMRYIQVGENPASIEAPHCIRTSDDGKYAYVSFYYGNYLQKIDCTTDQVVGRADLTAAERNTGGWNICFVSPQQDTAVVTSNLNYGVFTNITTSTMQVQSDKTITGLVNPHGIASNPTFDTFFVTGQTGNTVYKITEQGSPPQEISIDGRPAEQGSADSLADPDPHEIQMAPDYSKYFVTCQNSNEVRVMDAHTDKLLKVIPVGGFPQDMAISHTQPYLFVTCMQDQSAGVPSKFIGSVYVINYQTLSVVKPIYGYFFEPHGITVDDINGLVYIASLNYDTSGPPPHHVSVCGGRDGWYSVYNLNTLQPVNNIRYELAVFPYSAAARFKYPPGIVH
ncbi:MAG TPA: hypothetical protein VN721_00125 [Flavipsychrobacter sp.]|nr:hypothetical protein [Flavipsychrobacter sp.]